MAESNPPPERSSSEYNENTAVLIKDLIVCVARTPQGPMIMSNFGNRQEAAAIMLNVNIDIVNKIREFDRIKNRIEPEQGKIITFARKVFHK